MRPQAPASLLVVLVVATFLVRPLAHGVPIMTVLVFWATALGQVIVPGVLLVRGARLTAADRWLTAGQGAALGLALQGLAVLLGRALGVTWLAASVALLAAGAGLALSRRAEPSAPDERARGASVLTLSVVLAGCLLQPLLSAQRLDEPLPFDLLFHAGNAAELRHRWPFEDPRVAGVPLAYHMLAYALPVEAADRAGAPVADPLLALAPLLWVALLAIQAANVGRALFGSERAGALGAAVLLLHADPGPFFGLRPGAFNSHLATGIYGSPTTICGLVLLAGLVIALGEWLADAARSKLALLFVLALAASAAKTTVLPVVLAGVAAAGLRALWLGRREELRGLALALGVMAAAGAPLTLWQTGGEEGYAGFVGIGAATVYTKSPFAAALASAAGGGGLATLVAVPGFVLWLVGYLGLAGVAAALWLTTRRREPLATLQVVALGTFAAGLALGLVLDVPGLSQLFPIYNGQLLLALFAGAFLDTARLSSWRPALALAMGAVLLFLALPAIAQLVRGVSGAVQADMRAAAHVPAAVERDYAAGLAWLREHASRDAVVFADNSSLLLSAIGEVRLYYENGLYTARAWRAGPGREPWPERVALQERLLRRTDVAAVAEARSALGPGPRLLIAADAVQSRIETGFVHAEVGPVASRRLFPAELFQRAYASSTLQVYAAREAELRP